MRIKKVAFEFEWDEGNVGKNKKHNVEDREAEEVFLDDGKVIFKDKLHSTGLEERFILLGRSKKNRLLYVVFTERDKKLRIISARGINKKEVHLYEETT